MYIRKSDIDRNHRGRRGAAARLPGHAHPMSDEITNPLHGKFDEVVEALVKGSPEEGGCGTR